MKLLVTGAAGFIGSHYVRTLLSGGYVGYENAEVTVYDKLTYAGNLENLAPVADDPRYRFIQGDILDGSLLDEVLPGHCGRTLADTALEVRPGLKVLFTTGYSRNAIVHQGRLDAGVQLISKPFTFEQLATRIRDVLESHECKV